MLEKKLKVFLIVGGTVYVLKLILSFFLWFPYSSYLYVLMEYSALACIAYGVFLLFRVQYLKIKTELIKENYNRAKKEIELYGFNTKKHFSSFGHKYFEFRTNYSAKDNVHVEVDEDKKVIITYTLTPYSLKIYNYNNLKNVEIKECIDGTVVAIKVVFEFENGDKFALSANDNIKCTYGDATYNKAKNDAQTLIEYFKSLKA